MTGPQVSWEAAQRDVRLHTLDRAEEAAAVIRERFHTRPDAAIILGTGLGRLGAAIESPVAVEYADIPNFPL